MTLIHPFIAYFFTAITGLIIMALLCLIFMRSDHRQTNRFLALTLVFCVIDCLYYSLYFRYPEFALQYPHFYGFQTLSVFLIFPGFYLYATELLNLHSAKKLRYWPHYLPFLIMTFGVMPLLIAAPEHKRTILEAILSGQQPDFNTLNLPPFSLLFLALSHFVYLVMVPFYSYKIYQDYQQHQTLLGEVFSDVNSIKTRWMWGLVGFCLIYMLCLIVLIGLMWASQRFSLISLNLFLAANGLLYLYIASQAVFHPYLYTQTLLTKLQQYTEEEKTKYQHAAIPDTEAEAISQQIIEHIETDKPYLNEQLTIKDLADALHIKRSQVISEVINKTLGKNFYQLINHYRAKEAKRLIDLGQAPNSVLRLGLEVGFNSTATFNRRFKELTGYSPKQYQNLNNS